MISSPLIARWLPIRKVSRSRLDRSAQCASSMTSTTGECRASWSSTLSISSNSRARASPGSRSGPVSGSPSSGSSRASPRVVRPGSIEATASAPSSWTRSRSIAVNGANGSPSVPSSRQPPVSTRAPAAGAAWPNSPTSRDLPTPASPPSSTAVGPPWRTLANAASRAAICSSRPTRTGLAARPLISAVSMPRGSDIPARGRAGAGAVTAASGGAAGGGHAACRLVLGGPERAVHVVGDGRATNASASSRWRAPRRTARRARLAVLASCARAPVPAAHGRAARSVHAESRDAWFLLDPLGACLVPHILKVRRKAPPPASDEFLIFRPGRA